MCIYSMLICIFINVCFITNSSMQNSYKMAGNIDLELKRINLDLNEVIEYVNHKNTTNDSSNPVS